MVGSSNLFKPRAFNTNRALSSFNATGGVAVAVLTTGEVELSPGGRAFVQGIKPLADVVTANAMTVAIGTRDDQTVTTPSFTSDVTVNSRTGFSDFRSSARYHRARLTISSSRTFNAAAGIEFQFVPDGIT